MKKAPAFTLIELLIALLISGILIAVTVSMYSLFRTSISRDQARANISQNGRIALDRLTRDLRQTPDIVTDLPLDPTDTSVLQPNEVLFEDGHTEDLTYRRYYLANGQLKLDTQEYYFAYQTSVRVRWNAIGNGGVSPVLHIITTQTIADNLQSFVLYNNNSVIQVFLTTTDGGNQIFPLRTSVEARNL